MICDRSQYGTIVPLIFKADWMGSFSKVSMKPIRDGTPNMPQLQMQYIDPIALSGLLGLQLLHFGQSTKYSLHRLEHLSKRWNGYRI